MVIIFDMYAGHCGFGTVISKQVASRFNRDTPIAQAYKVLEPTGVLPFESDFLACLSVPGSSLSSRDGHLHGSSHPRLGGLPGYLHTGNDSE